MANHDSAERIAALEAELAELRAQLRDVEHEGAANSPAKHRLALAERTASVGTWSWDLASDQIEWSDEMFRIFGYEPRAFEPTASHFYGAIEPMDRARVQEESRRAVQSGIVMPSEFSLLRPDGSARRVRLHSAFVPNARGERAYMVGTILDLTEGHRSDEIAFRTADELKRAQRVARMGSFTWTFDPPRLEWSPGMYRLLGLNGQEEPSEQLFHRHVHPEDLPILLSKRREAIESGVAEPVEFRIVSAGGTVLCVELESQDLRDEAGKLYGFRGVIQDVTRRRALEYELRQSQKMEAIGRLAGGVAHDFNNYLMLMTGHAELIESGLAPGDPLKASAEAIVNACERCAGLTNQLLTLGRRRAGSSRPVQLGSLLRRLVPALRPMVGSAIRVDLHEEEPDALVVGDEGQLEQVIVNLALNARDAMPNGGAIKFTVERIVATKGGSNVRLVIADDGEGIPPEHRARIFEPFFSTKGNGHGTGLGLSTVYWIVQQAGGQIAVESELGKGTTFRIDLLSSDELPASPSSQLPPVAQVPRTVLLVEDIGELRELLRGQLERAGHQVFVAEHGAAALALLGGEGRKVELVITDVVMPVMGGLELEQRLAVLRPELPCILMSAYADGLVSEHAQKRAILRKPFSIRQLLTEIGRALPAS